MARRAPPTTKPDLLEAARRCFAAQGLEATKVEDITAQVGIAKGAFYSYFESKEECWKQIVEQFLATLREAVNVHETGVQSARNIALPERLEIWLEHDLRVLEFCWNNREMLKMLTNGSGGAAYAHLLDEFAASCAGNAEALVRDLVADRVYRNDIDPALVGCMLGGAYDRLVRALIREPKRPDLASKSRQAQRLFLHGLLTEGAREQLSGTLPVTQSAARATKKSLARKPGKLRSTR